MKLDKGLISSFILHLLIFIIAYFGLPSISKKPLDELVMSVDIVQVSNISNIKQKKAQKASNEEIKEKEVKKDIPKPSVKEPEKTEKVEKDEKPVEKEIKEEKPVVEPPKKIEKKEEVKEKKPEKKQDDTDLDSLLKTLEKSAKKNDSTEKPDKKEEPKQKLEEQTKAEGKYDKDMPLSFSDKDAIRNQITDMWNFQAGAKDAGELKAKLLIKIEKDGTVTSVEASDAAKYSNGSTAYKAFVASAIRAVKRASPLKNLSQERYDSWGEIELNFDPSGLLF